MRRRLYAPLAVLCLVASPAVGVNAAAATPATAATAAALNRCSDRTTFSPTGVHRAALDSSGVIKTLPNNYAVTGTCNYFEDYYSPYHWFMQVALGTGGYGYIWVQRLQHGAAHHCNRSGTLYPIEYYSPNCPLYYVGE